MTSLFTPKKTTATRIHQNPRGGKQIQAMQQNAYTKLTAKHYGHLNWRNLEAGRRAMTRLVKRRIKVQVMVRLTQPITNKPLQARMGKGKGKLKGWIGYVVPGTTLYTIGFTTQTAMKNNSDVPSRKQDTLPFDKITHKFPFKFQIANKVYLAQTRLMEEVQFTNNSAPLRKIIKLQKKRKKNNKLKKIKVIHKVFFFRKAKNHPNANN